MTNNLDYFHDRIDSLRNELQNASDTMAELATSLLREAIEGENDALVLEKNLQKARRALAKAMQLMGSQIIDYDNE